MEDSGKNQNLLDNKIRKNECPEKDKDGNCRVPGTFSDSDPIGGG
jgi:hypothetical protein